MSDNVNSSSDYADDQRAVSTRYKEAALELPSETLDAAILAMAHKHIPQDKLTTPIVPRKKKTWLFPSSVAVSIVLVTFVYFVIEPQQYQSNEPVAMSVPEAVKSVATEQVEAEVSYASTAVSSPAPVVTSRNEDVISFSIDSLNKGASEEGLGATLSADETTEMARADILHTDEPGATSTIEQLYQSLIALQEQLKMSHTEIMAISSYLDSERSVNLKAKTSFKVQSLAATRDDKKNTQQAHEYHLLQVDLYNALIVEKQNNAEFVLSEKYQSLLSNKQRDSLLTDN